MSHNHSVSELCKSVQIHAWNCAPTVLLWSWTIFALEVCNGLHPHTAQPLNMQRVGWRLSNVWEILINTWLEDEKLWRGALGLNSTACYAVWKKKIVCVNLEFLIINAVKTFSQRLVRDSKRNSKTRRREKGLGEGMRQRAERRSEYMVHSVTCVCGESDGEEDDGGGG